MSYPPYSYLPPATVDIALDMARELRRASTEVAELSRTGPENRRAAQAHVIETWSGPAQAEFLAKCREEVHSALAVERELANEAEEFARFWATATNARIDRLHQEALDRHHQEMRRYDSNLVAYHQRLEGTVMEQAPARPTAPVPPTRPDVVATPRAENQYRPTG